MKKFSYTIKDENGIHARPAGIMVKKAKEFESKITIEKNGKTADVSKLLSLMGLGIKCGETINVTAEGTDENQAADAIEEFLKNNL